MLVLGVRLVPGLHGVRLMRFASAREEFLWRVLDVMNALRAHEVIASAEPDQEVGAVCGSVSFFATDQLAFCCRCGRPVVRRSWHDAERVKFFCLACFAEEQGEGPGEES